MKKIEGNLVTIGELCEFLHNSRFLEEKYFTNKP